MEQMSEFFAARVNGYDEHMMNNVVGCKEGYKKMAELLPDNTVELLDLGCGTGIELHEIFHKFPDIKVTGVDMTKAMLEKLQKKYAGKNITIVHDNYLVCDFGASQYDVVISFETMHHYTHKQKVELYSRINAALRPAGRYIECDYMILEQQEENYYFAESNRMRRELGLLEGELFHYDTPCTIENQKKLLLKSGFSRAEKVWRMGQTTIVIGYKESN